MALYKSEKIEALAAALVAAQSELKAIHKDKTANIQTKTGGQYAYSYADLATVIEVCRPVLAKHKLAVTQVLGNLIGAEGGSVGIAVQTLLVHESGEYISSDYGLTCAMDDPKSAGSVITYLRRYGYQALVGIASEEDDDGAAGSRAAPKVNRETGEVENPSPEVAASMQKCPDCGAATVRKESQSAENAGRPYYRCSTAKWDRQTKKWSGCQFFAWEDEALGKQAAEANPEPVLDTTWGEILVRCAALGKKLIDGWRKDHTETEAQELLIVWKPEWESLSKEQRNEARHSVMPQLEEMGLV
ncbi:MAG: ERF family protein [bacterium]